MSGLKSVIQSGQNFFHGVMHRINKKNQTIDGGTKGGPKKARRFVFIVSVAAAAGFAALLFMRGELGYTGAQIVEHDTKPGIKRQVDTLSSGDPYLDRQIELRTAEIASAGVDCDKIMSSLRIYGTLSEDDRLAYDKCREKLGDNVAKVVDAILSGEIPGNVAPDLVRAVTSGNPEVASSVARAVSDPAIVEALRGQSGREVARIIPSLSKLTPKELSTAIDAIAKAPDIYRGRVADAVREASILEPEARSALITQIAAERDPESVGALRELASSMKGLSADEQVKFSNMLDALKSPEERLALSRTAKEIALAPEGSEQRRLMMSGAESAARAGSAEERIKMLSDLGVVGAALGDKTPEAARRVIVKALEDALASGRESPSKIATLRDRIQNISTVGEIAKPTLQDVEDYLKGGPVDTVEKFNRTAELIKGGEQDAAKLAFEGKLSEKDRQKAIERMNEKKDASQLSEVRSGETKTIVNPATTAKTLEGELKKAESQETAIRETIAAVKRQGLPEVAMEEQLKSLYSSLKDTSEKKKALRLELAEALKAVSAKRDEILKSLPPDLRAYGITIREESINTSAQALAEAKSKHNPRLSDIRDVAEFWEGSDGSGRSAKTFLRLQGSGVGNESVFERESRRIRPGESKYVTMGGQAQQGQGAEAPKFRLSRLIRVPGKLRRVPASGIASRGGAFPIIEFEFMTSVVDRTGRMTIPEGAVAICKVKEISVETTRLLGECDAVDVNGEEDIDVSFVLADADRGSDGIPGEITDQRGWYLFGTFMTAFSSYFLDAFTQNTYGPIDSKAAKSLADYLLGGATKGGGDILRDVSSELIERWKSQPVIWNAPEGIPVSIREK